MAGTETRRLSRTTTFRMSDAEVAALRDAADARGIGPSALARVLIMEALGRQPARVRRRRTAAEVGQFLGELGRIGNNVNQLARVANRSGDVSAQQGWQSVLTALETLTITVLAVTEPGS